MQTASEPSVCWFTPAELPELHRGKKKKNATSSYMWISCLLIRGIQILVVLLQQKTGKRFLSHFALWQALKPSWRLKLQLSLICSCTKLFKLILLSTHIYSLWIMRMSPTRLTYLYGLSGGDTQVMIFSSPNGPPGEVAFLSEVPWVAWWSGLPPSVKQHSCYLLEVDTTPARSERFLSYWMPIPVKCLCGSRTWI